MGLEERGKEMLNKVLRENEEGGVLVGRGRLLRLKDWVLKG